MDSESHEYCSLLTQITKTATIAKDARLTDAIMQGVAMLMYNKKYSVRPTAIYMNPMDKARLDAQELGEKDKCKFYDVEVVPRRRIAHDEILQADIGAILQVNEGRQDGIFRDMPHLDLLPCEEQECRTASVDDSLSVDCDVLDALSPENALVATVSIDVVGSHDHGTFTEHDVHSALELYSSGDITSDAELECSASLGSDEVDGILDGSRVVGDAVAADSEEGCLIYLVLCETLQGYKQEDRCDY
jgi:hypothetical protein